MSNSPLVSYTKISPNKTSPRNHVIDTITIHCYVGQVTVERMGKGWSKPGKVSANYGVAKDGKIGLYVEEKDRAWTSSNRKNDMRAITIEVASDSKSPYAITDAAYNSLVQLCADICRRNNIPGLKWKADKTLIGQVDKQNMTVHRWFASKSCPGKYIYDRLGQIAAEVNALLGVEPSDPEPEPADKLPPDGFNPTPYEMEEFVSDVQKACGAKVDGIAGPETLSKTVTISAEINRRHPVVKPVQKRLYVLGYTDVGDADGIAGPKFTKAVKQYQTNNNCIVDGEITARKTTWRCLLGLR